MEDLFNNIGYLDEGLLSLGTLILIGWAFYRGMKFARHRWFNSNPGKPHNGEQRILHAIEEQNKVIRAGFQRLEDEQTVLIVSTHRKLDTITPIITEISGFMKGRLGN